MGCVAVERGNHDVEQAVVIKIVHDRAAGLIEAIDADQMSDVSKLADVELRMEELVQIQSKPGINAVGILAQGHVRQIEQPCRPRGRQGTARGIR